VDQAVATSAAEPTSVYLRMAAREVKRAAPGGRASQLIHRCVRDPARPADVTPELLGPAAARTHDRRLILLAKATNGLAIARRPTATGVAVQWALLGIRSRLGPKACPSAGSTEGWVFRHRP
jgi:hypothetical protein